MSGLAAKLLFGLVLLFAAIDHTFRAFADHRPLNIFLAIVYFAAFIAQAWSMRGPTEKELPSAH